MAGVARGDLTVRDTRNEKTCCARALHVYTQKLLLLSGIPRGGRDEETYERHALDISESDP